MKIAFISQPGEELIPPVDGGSSIATVTYQFARRLARNHEVIIYGARHTRPTVEWDEHGIQHRRVPVAIESRVLKPLQAIEHVVGLGPARSPFTASCWYYPGYMLQIAKDLRTQQCDVIHLHNYSQYVPMLRAYCPRATIVLHMHCDWLAQLDRDMLEERLRETDLIIGCSDFVTGNARRRFPEFASKCHTVYNGVDQDRFLPAYERKPERSARPMRIVMVGRVSPEKGVHTLIEAMANIIQEVPNVHLDVIGRVGLIPYHFIVGLSDDERVQSLRAFYGQSLADKFRIRVVQRGESYFSRVKALMTSAVEPHVLFTGFYPHSELATHYQGADLFVNASYSEAFPLPILEAMATGLPVVASDVGGIPEAVDDGRTGLLVPVGDAGRLAEAICRVLKDDRLRLSMGRAGREQAIQRFSWDVVATELEDLYETSCSSHAAIPVPAYG